MKYLHLHGPELHELEIDEVWEDSELLGNPLVRCRGGADMHALN